MGSFSDLGTDLKEDGRIAMTVNGEESLSYSSTRHGWSSR